jgi:hypothetical protein
MFYLQVTKYHKFYYFLSALIKALYIGRNWLRLTIIRNLQDQFEQYWHSLLDNASKAINYRLFKDYFGMEVYFDILDNKNVVVELCRFRTANHKLPIEIGRWNNTNRNDIILLFMSISKGYLPSSPYIIYNGVDNFK